jgi:hypothetical protein
MNARWIAVMAAVGLFALPALAGAAPQLTADGVGIDAQPTHVQVVVDFNGRIKSREVELSRFGQKLAAVRLLHPGVTTQTDGLTGNRVRVALQPGTQMLHITTSFARHRFKYLSYAVVRGNRLAIDLWKSAPPKKPSQTCSGLKLAGDWSADGSVVSAKGREHGIFENQFRVVVRGQNGAVLGRKTVTGPGRWAAKVHYHVAHSQNGTVEAVAFSAKDGSLECLAQHWVRLPAT